MLILHSEWLGSGKDTCVFCRFKHQRIYASDNERASEITTSTPNRSKFKQSNKRAHPHLRARTYVRTHTRSCVCVYDRRLHDSAYLPHHHHFLCELSHDVGTEAPTKKAFFSHSNWRCLSWWPNYWSLRSGANRFCVKLGVELLCICGRVAKSTCENFTGLPPNRPKRADELMSVLMRSQTACPRFRGYFNSFN